MIPFTAQKHTYSVTEIYNTETNITVISEPNK